MRKLRLGLRILALCGVTTLLFAPTGSAQQVLWPNLRPKPAFNLQLVTNSATGGGKEVRFSVTSFNWGLGPLELIAGETGSQGQNVYQRIYKSDGTYRGLLRRDLRVASRAQSLPLRGLRALLPGAHQRAGRIAEERQQDDVLHHGHHEGGWESAWGSTAGRLCCVWQYDSGHVRRLGGHLRLQPPWSVRQHYRQPERRLLPDDSNRPQGQAVRSGRTRRLWLVDRQFASSLLRIDVERNTVTVLDNTGCSVSGEVVVASISPASAAPARRSR